MRGAFLLGLVASAGCIDWSQLASPGDGSIDAPRPPTFPRLVVGTQLGELKIWDNADSLSGEARPSSTVTIAGTIQALGLRGDRLFVAMAASSNLSQLLVYDGAPWLDGSTTPRHTVPLPLYKATEIRFDGDGNLWLLDGISGSNWVGRFDDALAVNGTSTAAASFVPWGFAQSMAIDDADRLFVATLDQNRKGIVVWNKATTRTDHSGVSEWTLDNVTAYKLALANDRLYAAQDGVFRIWNGVSRIAVKTEPNETVSSTSSGYFMDLSLKRDILVYVATDVINIWRDANLIGSGSTPTGIIPAPPGAHFWKIATGSSGRLYVVSDGNDVLVYNMANPEAQPLVLHIGSLVADLLLME